MKMLGLTRAYNEKPIFLVTEDLEILNEIMKDEIPTNMASYLSSLFIYLHKRLAFHLENFELSDNYYLDIAENLAKKSEDEIHSLYNLFIIYKLKEDYSEAEKTITDLIEKSNKEKYIYEKASLLKHLGKWGAALQLYNEILQKNPKNEEAWEDMGDILVSKEKYEDAAIAYLKSLELDKENKELWFKHGICLKKMDRWGGALQSFENVIKLDESYEEAYEFLLTILEQRKMYDKMLFYLNKLKKLGVDVDDKIAKIKKRNKK